MPNPNLPKETRARVEREHMSHLIEALRQRGYQVVGPKLSDGAIIYDELLSIDELPIGWTDEQEGGTYRLKRRDDQALFGYVVGPYSWKKFLHPPVLSLWQAQKSPEGLTITCQDAPEPKFAFIGVRACELHAIAIQDRVLLGGPYVDPWYALRRQNVFVVAVNCGQAGGTCFCASMHTGPRVTLGFDLALTEIIENKQHYFIVEVGSEQGAQVLDQVPHSRAQPQDINQAERVATETAAHMGRTLDTTGIQNLLYRNYQDPSWDEVATRCLTCANCTMVCPTCFCATVEDVTDLTGGQAERLRKWDSCFTMDFSYIHGGSIRATPRTRYRQWMTHKLATWIEQFGTSGCVGCGRCITWCPAAIDITAQVRTIRANEGTKPGV